MVKNLRRAPEAPEALEAHRARVAKLLINQLKIKFLLFNNVLLDYRALGTHPSSHAARNFRRNFRSVRGIPTDPTPQQQNE